MTELEECRESLKQIVNLKWRQIATGHIDTNSAMYKPLAADKADSSKITTMFISLVLKHGTGVIENE